MPPVRRKQLDTTIVYKKIDTVDPTVSDDINSGFDKAEIWLNTSTNRSYICLDNSAGAAIWHDFSTNTHSYTGHVSGGEPSINVDNTKFDVSEGKGYIVDNSDPDNKIITVVEWTAKTAVVATFLTSDSGAFIGIDSSGNVVQQVEDFKPGQPYNLRNTIRLGRISHFNKTIIDKAYFYPYHFLSCDIDYACCALFRGTTSAEGGVIGNNGANLKLDFSKWISRRIGANYDTDPNNPNTPVVPGVSQFSFFSAYDSGTGSTTLSASTTDLDPTMWDDGSGTLQALNVNQYTIKEVVLFPNNTDYTGMILYGQEVFNTIGEAEEALQTYRAQINNDILGGSSRALILIKQSATDLDVEISAGRCIIASITSQDSVVASSVNYFDRVGTQLQPKTITDDIYTEGNFNTTVSYQLNGTNINTTGTLSNVAYKAQDNIFSVIQTYASHPTFTLDTELIDKKYVDDVLLTAGYWARTGSVLSPKTAGDDVDFGTGGLKDNDVTIAVFLGDLSNTSFDTTNKTIIGSVNELNTIVTAITTSYSRRKSVIDYVDNTVAPPTEVSSDRYILDFTVGTVHADWDGASKGDIVEFNGSVWNATTPLEGYVAYVDNQNKDILYVDDGSPDWELRNIAISNHNDLSAIQGGTTNEYYHLTSSEHSELSNWLDNVSLSTDGTINIDAGATYQIDSSDINTTGTLSNVAYKAQDNTFSVIQTYTVHPTFTIDTEIVDKKYVDDSVGYWSRVSTTLSPLNSGDDVDLGTGDLAATDVTADNHYVSTHRLNVGSSPDEFIIGSNHASYSTISSALAAQSGAKLYRLLPETFSEDITFNNELGARMVGELSTVNGQIQFSSGSSVKLHDITCSGAYGIFSVGVVGYLNALKLDTGTVTLGTLFSDSTSNTLISTISNCVIDSKVFIGSTSSVASGNVVSYNDYSTITCTTGDASYIGDGYASGKYSSIANRSNATSSGSNVNNFIKLSGSSDVFSIVNDANGYDNIINQSDGNIYLTGNYLDGDITTSAGNSYVNANYINGDITSTAASGVTSYINAGYCSGTISRSSPSNLMGVIGNPTNLECYTGSGHFKFMARGITTSGGGAIFQGAITAGLADIYFDRTSRYLDTHVTANSSLYQYRVYNSYSGQSMKIYSDSLAGSNGTVYASSGILTRTNPSDARLKKNIEYIDCEGYIEKVKSLIPAKFNWKLNGKEDLNFIAQDMLKIFPENVSKDMMPVSISSDNKDDGTPTNFVYEERYGLKGRSEIYLWLAVQELIKKVESLEDKLIIM